MRGPSFFEIRYRHGSASGKALSPKCFSSAIYTEVVKIFNALNLKREKPLIDLLADIIEHGDVVVPMAEGLVATKRGWEQMFVFLKTQK